MVSNRQTLAASSELSLFPLDIVVSDLDVIVELGQCTNAVPRGDDTNSHLLADLSVAQPYGIPIVAPTNRVPEKLVSFSEAVGIPNPDPTAYVHFYENEDKIIRFWRQPEKYLPLLNGFAGLIGCDLSVYRDMEPAVKIYNTYRNFLLTAWPQSKGIAAIANVRLSGLESIDYALAGVPRESTLAIGLNGCTKDHENRSHVFEEVRLICDYCKPTALVCYGSDRYGVLDYPKECGIPVYLFKPDSYRRSKDRCQPKVGGKYEQAA